MNKVKELRIKNQLKQKDVAHALGICSDYLSLIERERQTPGFKLATKIADFYNVSIDDLKFFKNAKNESFDDALSLKQYTLGAAVNALALPSNY